jgi:hypothetical protein
VCFRIQPRKNKKKKYFILFYFFILYSMKKASSALSQRDRDIARQERLVKRMRAGQERQEADHVRRMLDIDRGIRVISAQIVNLPQDHEWVQAVRVCLGVLKGTVISEGRGPSKAYNMRMSGRRVLERAEEKLEALERG